MAEQWRILIVEGEENLNRNMVSTLQKDGYFARGVTSGAEAIRLLWSEECDVVICDQQIPDADGFDLLQWMRTYCPKTRMVMLAAPGSSMSMTQALEMGVASYLEAPLDMRALKEELRRLLHQTGFSASLDSFDLLDVIQIITMSRKSIALVVSIGVEEEGILRFQNGELIWAEYGMLRGEEAFFALAAHKNGTVVHRPWNEQITPNVTQPLSRLIFQALQYRSKYADYQQLSSELEPVKSGWKVPDPPTLPPLPPTTLPDALLDLEEEDDRPFQFVAEDAPAGQAALGTGAGSMAFEQFMRSDISPGLPLEPPGGVMGTVKHTEQGIPSGNGMKKEWWEATGSFPRPQKAAQVQAITDEALAPPHPPGGLGIPSLNARKAANEPSPALPAWLTDQPTNLDLPVLRGNTGQMPVPPKEQSGVMPAVQNNTGKAPAPNSVPLPTGFTQPPQLSPSAAFPPVQPVQPGLSGLNPSESGLRKIKPDEALFTGTQRAVKSGISQPPRPASAEWQVPGSPLANSLTGQINAVKTPGAPGQGNETLQSLAALKRTPGNSAPGNSVSVPPVPTPIPQAAGSNPGIPPVPFPEVRASGSSAGTGATKAVREMDSRPGVSGVGRSDEQKSVKRNYPALAAALQTLGYSVPGFVASAVVSLDGTPIAQVAVDDLDISPMCTHFSQAMQNVLLALEQRNSDSCEYTMIVSRTQYVLLRLIEDKKEVFQVLITARETNPAESLEVIANIEAAIAAALH